MNEINIPHFLKISTKRIFIKNFIDRGRERKYFREILLANYFSYFFNKYIKKCHTKTKYFSINI